MCIGKTGAAAGRKNANEGDGRHFRKVCSVRISSTANKEGSSRNRLWITVYLEGQRVRIV